MLAIFVSCRIASKSAWAKNLLPADVMMDPHSEVARVFHEDQRILILVILWSLITGSYLKHHIPASHLKETIVYPDTFLSIKYGLWDPPSIEANRWVSASI